MFFNLLVYIYFLICFRHYWCACRLFSLILQGFCVPSFSCYSYTPFRGLWRFYMSTGKILGIFHRGPSGGAAPRPEPPLQLGEGLPPLPESLPVFVRNRKKSKPFDHKGFSLSNLIKHIVVKRFWTLSFHLLPNSFRRTYNDLSHMYLLIMFPLIE